MNHEQYFNSLYAIVARVKYRNSFSIKSSQQPIWHYYDECRWCSVIYLSVMWQQMAIINKFLSRDTRKGCRKLLFFSWPVLRLYCPFLDITIFTYIVWYIFKLSSYISIILITFLVANLRHITQIHIGCTMSVSFQRIKAWHLKVPTDNLMGWPTHGN